MPDMFKPTKRDVIEELERELGVRKAIYPDWVRRNRMRQDTADWRITCLEKALELLRGD